MSKFEQGITVGLIIAAIGMFFIMLIVNSDNVDNRISELSQSICDQEYDMDFDNYNNGVLKCKPKEVRAEVQYDGIVVEIGK